MKRKSIQSVFSINRELDDEQEKNSFRLLQIGNSFIKDDPLSFDKDYEVKNNNQMKNYNAESSPSIQNQNSIQSQYNKNVKNFKKFNQNDTNEKQQSKDEDQNYMDNFILSSPTSNVFKSNEGLFVDSSSSRKDNTQRKLDFGSQRQEDDNKFISKQRTVLGYNIHNPTQNNAFNKQKNNQTLQSEQVQNTINTEMNTQDDYNFRDDKSHAQQKFFSAKLDSERITSMNNEQLSESKDQININKISFDNTISQRQQTLESKRDDQITESQNLDTIPTTNQGNTQNAFIRKQTNTQSVNLPQSKFQKKFFGRKSEFGLMKSQLNTNAETPCSSPISRQVELQSKEAREKQIQLSIIERFQQKNWKYGSKVQRSESASSNQKLDMKQQSEIKQLKKWNIVDKLYILLKAKHKLKNLIKQRLSALSQYERGLIGDLSDAKSISKNINEQVKLFQQIIFFTFNPESFPIIIFKIILLITSILNLIYIPILLGFSLEISHLGLAFLTFSSVSFIAEVVIKFKTSLYEKGEIITNTTVIAQKILIKTFHINQIMFWLFQRYIKNGLITDIISIVGLMLGQAQRYFFMLMILRIINVLKYMQDLNNHYYLAEKFHKLWVLSGLFGFIVMMAHYFACIFHFIGSLQEDDPHTNTWIKAQNIQDADWIIRYNFALYFSFITCMTIGYGDIAPKNPEERGAVILFSFVSTMCFSYSVNTIGNIFQDYFNKFQKQLQNQNNKKLFIFQLKNSSSLSNFRVFQIISSSIFDSQYF